MDQAFAIWDTKRDLHTDRTNQLYLYTSREAAQAAIDEHADMPSDWAILELGR